MGNDSNQSVGVSVLDWLQQAERLARSSVARHDQYNYTHKQEQTRKPSLEVAPTTSARRTRQTTN